MDLIALHISPNMQFFKHESASESLGGLVKTNCLAFKFSDSAGSEKNATKHTGTCITRTILGTLGFRVTLSNTSHKDICNYWRLEEKFQVLSLSDPHLVLISTYTETLLVCMHAHTHVHTHTHTLSYEEYKIRPQFRIKLTSEGTPCMDLLETHTLNPSTEKFLLDLLPHTFHPFISTLQSQPLSSMLSFLSFFSTAERGMKQYQETQSSPRLIYIKK